VRSARPDRGRHRGNTTKARRNKLLAVIATAAVAVLAVVVGLEPGGWRQRAVAGSGAVLTHHPVTRTTPTLPKTPTPSSAAAAPSGTPPPTAVPPANSDVGSPISVTITRLGVAASLQHLALQGDGSLQSPSDWNQAGWYADGVRPGQAGPAILAGHVESSTGPAAFYRLPAAEIGDDVAVVDDRGVTRHFIVNDVKSYPNVRFPSEAVYGATPFATVRLITCYGAFDPATRTYIDNVVVSAVLKS
jgi:hypothetical protein